MRKGVDIGVPRDVAEVAREYKKPVVYQGGTSLQEILIHN
jgi:hypothetical protein